jgi:signal transduction histidine kinase
VSAGLEGDVEFFAESLNASQFPEGDHDRMLRDYYVKKYRDRKLDLIVGVMGPAVTFLLRHADEVAPDVPVVFCGADADDIKGITLPARMTGLVVRRVFGPTLDVALRLQPDTRHVFVVGGTSDFDRHLQAVARREFQRFEPRISLTYLTDLSMADLLKAVRVPAHSVILYLSLFRDGTGQTFVPHEVASRISAAAAAPVYIFVDQYLGAGPVGGYLYSLELHGKAAADIGLRVLRGESPAAIPIREVSDNQNMFDARQLDRWRLDTRLLPTSSVILFREPSVWDRYRVYIIGAAALVSVQAALIVGLLVHRTRRRRAEADLRASFVRIREIGGRLLRAQETERIRIARELHDDISQQLVLLTMDLAQLTGVVDADAKAVAGEAAKYAEDIATSVRDLSHRLYPAKLQLLGLVAAIEGLLGELSHRKPRITLTHENVPKTLPPDLTLCLFRVVQEAVQNALKHSHAENMSVHLSVRSDVVALVVIDDGVGFDVDSVYGQGLGLVSMAERLEAFGGTFKVQSSPQSGTRLDVSVPLVQGTTAIPVANECTTVTSASPANAPLGPSSHRTAE